VNPLSDPQLQSTLTGVFQLVAPEIALVGAACIAFLVGCVYNRRLPWFIVSFLGVVLAAILAATVPTSLPAVLTESPILWDGMAEFIRWTALISTAVLLFVSWAEVEDAFAAEYFGSLLIAAAGVSLVGRANDLITLFLALELLSIPTYILLYLPVRTRPNQEAAGKYFLLSIMSSGILLFGFSYLYGLVGSTNITVILDALAKANAEALSPMAFLAIVMVIAALCFRITAVPFHFYAPDVYEAGPPGVIAQLAFFPKVAGFAALLRLLGMVGLDPWSLPFDARTQLPLLLWIIAILTMTFGNVFALLQDNVRRMLAYSSVAHAGYMLIGVVVASALPDLFVEMKRNPTAVHELTIGGVNGVLFYLAAYGMMTVGAFAVILYLSTTDRPIAAIDDLAGISKSHPISAASMAIFLFSLIGLPLTVGFYGKLLLFIGAFNAPRNTEGMGNLYLVLAVVAAVNAAIGAYYYLRVIGVMYLRTPLRPVIGSRAYPTLAAIVALAAATVFFGIYSNPLEQAARNASPSMHRTP
jgi:NADH-quinone oxidoreductase subunit N